MTARGPAWLHCSNAVASLHVAVFPSSSFVLSFLSSTTPEQYIQYTHIPQCPNSNSNGASSPQAALLKALLAISGQIQRPEASTISSTKSLLPPLHPLQSAPRISSRKFALLRARRRTDPTKSLCRTPMSISSTLRPLTATTTRTQDSASRLERMCSVRRPSQPMPLSWRL